MKNYDDIGCRVHLNPNGSDLRCGDKLGDPFNGKNVAVQLCALCSLKKQNSTLIDMLNRRHASNQKGEQ